MMSGRMQETSFDIIDVYIIAGLIFLYYICVLMVIIYKLCKSDDNSVMTSHNCPPSYDAVIELDELSCPSYNEINV